MLKRSLLSMVAGLLVSTAWADDFAAKKLVNWHQFRGPEATGVAPYGDPPTVWSGESNTNIKWKVAIPGRGSASPIVWDDRIFVLTAVRTDRTGEADTTAVGDERIFRQVAYAEEAIADADADASLLAQRGAGRGGEEGRGRGRGGFGRGGLGGGGRFGGGAPPANYYQFIVLCLDRNTGRTLWERVAIETIPHEGHHETGSYASSSPITDGRYVWASFGSRGIYCYDLDGNLEWHKVLGRMRTRFSFGEGASPALYEDTLVVTWDHEDESFIVALDALTGEEKWRKDRDEVTTWGTPLILEHEGRVQVITNGETRVRSYDLASGEIIWECGGQGSNPIASPVATDSVAICMTGHRDPAAYAVPLDARGDVTGTDHIAWRDLSGSTPYVSSPLLYDGLLYFTKSRNAILSCLDAETGEAYIDQRRMPSMNSIYSSPVGAAGRVYFASREGTTVVFKHGRDFEVLATNHLDETIDASPAIVDKEMFIRGDTHLYCIAEN